VAARRGFTYRLVVEIPLIAVREVDALAAERAEKVLNAFILSVQATALVLKVKM